LDESVNGARCWWIWLGGVTVSRSPCSRRKGTAVRGNGETQREWRGVGLLLELGRATWSLRQSLCATRRAAPKPVGHGEFCPISENGDSVYDDNDCQRHFDVSTRLIHCSFAKTMYMKNVGVPSIYNFFSRNMIQFTMDQQLHQSKVVLIQLKL